MEVDFIYRDLQQWIEKNGKSRVLTKEDIVEYTGLSRTTVDKMLYGVQETGARARYHFAHIAERIARGQ